VKEVLHDRQQRVVDEFQSLQSAASKKWETGKESLHQLTEQTKDSLHQLSDRIEHNKDQLKDRAESLTTESTTTTTTTTSPSRDSDPVPSVLPSPSSSASISLPSSSAESSRVPSLGGYSGLHLNDSAASMADGARLAAMVQDQSEL